MFNLIEKFYQVREYKQLQQDYKSKGRHVFKMFLAWVRAVRAITHEYPLSQQLPIENNPNAFGMEGLPCLVDQVGGEKYRWGILIKIGRAKSFVCPNFSKEKVCDNVACRYHHAHQEYVSANKDYNIAVREFDKAEKLRNAARERAFGRQK